MENNIFKSVAFGGFDKQDVIHYIEQTAKETKAAQDKLKQENESLRKSLSELKTETESIKMGAETLRGQLEERSGRLKRAEAESQELKSRLEELSSRDEETEPLRMETELLREEVDHLTAQVAELSAQQEENISLREEIRRLTEQTEKLRPEAEDYAKFRDRVGTIECDAHRRAAELEGVTLAKLEQVTSAFQSRYEALMEAFVNTAAQVSAELQKMDARLTQLPKAMEPSGMALKELGSALEKIREHTGGAAESAKETTEPCDSSKSGAARDA